MKSNMKDSNLQPLWPVLLNHTSVLSFITVGTWVRLKHRRIRTHNFCIFFRRK